ncbi:hypothetical protein VTJ04DRAFT_4466 [Mycothermus thermophilus]|uniref:uncharacterized protein n=1 Tax=Humicola insolens TaxID=85995 RepID=UPI003742CBEF
MSGGGVEIAGLVLGAISVACMWQATAGILEIIGSTADFAHDAVILAQQLKLEATLLDRWGRTIGLQKLMELKQADVTSDFIRQQGDRRLLEEMSDFIRQQVDRRILDEKTLAVVRQTLGVITRIFKDANFLKEEYGLVTKNRDQQSIRLTITLRRTARDGNVTQDINRDLEDAEQLSRLRTLSLSKKLTWAIVDRKRFERLMIQLHQINSSLLQLIPDTAALVVDSLSLRINELMADNIRESTTQVNELRAQVNELRAQVQEMRKPRGLFRRFKRTPKPNGSEG